MTMTRLKIAAGNWKMNKSLNEAVELTKELSASDRADDVLTILGVPSVYLSKVSELLNDVSDIKVAAQNCHRASSGAYTGEISAPMLQSLGIPYVILGHSERRAYFNESNEELKAKVDIAFEHDIIPIFCCGESLEVRKSGNHVSLVCSQVAESLFHLPSEKMEQVIIAYEPIWAIGTGETASPEQAQEMHAAIRESIATKYGQSVADTIPILYGGSVKPGNAPDIFSKEDVDGGLVGGASLKSDSFSQIINSFQ